MADKLFWTAAFVTSLDDLPAKLTIGRAYFVENDSCIILDTGQGPVYYGRNSTIHVDGSTSSASIAEQVHSQISSLAKGMITTDALINYVESKLTRDIQHEVQTRIIETLTSQQSMQSIVKSVMNNAMSILLNERERKSDMQNYVAIISENHDESLKSIEELVKSTINNAKSIELTQKSIDAITELLRDNISVQLEEIKQLLEWKTEKS